MHCASTPAQLHINWEVVYSQIVTARDHPPAMATAVSIKEPFERFTADKLFGGRKPLVGFEEFACCVGLADRGDARESFAS
jgi:hypothetical protein